MVFYSSISKCCSSFLEIQVIDYAFCFHEYAIKYLQKVCAIILIKHAGPFVLIVDS